MTTFKIPFFRKFVTFQKGLDFFFFFKGVFSLSIKLIFFWTYRDYFLNLYNGTLFYIIIHDYLKQKYVDLGPYSERCQYEFLHRRGRFFMPAIYFYNEVSDTNNIKIIQSDFGIGTQDKIVIKIHSTHLTSFVDTMPEYSCFCLD